MEQTKLTRLNMLFEKAVAGKANIIEKRELSALYEEYIDDGRENQQMHMTTNYQSATA